MLGGSTSFAGRIIHFIAINHGTAVISGSTDHINIGCRLILERIGRIQQIGTAEQHNLHPFIIEKNILPGLISFTADITFKGRIVFAVCDQIGGVRFNRAVQIQLTPGPVHSRIRVLQGPAA
ncbi:hypothetical protein D3C73_1345140 [compost metagenome]